MTGYILFIKVTYSICVIRSELRKILNSLPTTNINMDILIQFAKVGYLYFLRNYPSVNGRLKGSVIKDYKLGGKSA